LKINFIDVVLSSLFIIIIYSFTVLNSYDNVNCNYNLCEVQTHHESLVAYVSAVPEGNYTSNPNPFTSPEDEKNKDDKLKQSEPIEPLTPQPGPPSDFTPPGESGAKETGPYTPPGNDKHGGNGVGNKGEQNSNGEQKNGIQQKNSGERTAFEHTTFDTPISTVTNTTNTTGSNATTTNATGTNPGMNGILDSLKNIFGGIVGNK